MNVSPIITQDWETGGPSNANTWYSLCFCLAEERQQLVHSNQAESHTAVDQGTAQQQKQDSGDPGRRL